MDNYERMNSVDSTMTGTNPETKWLKTCSKCGTELQEGQVFCSKCGQKVGASVTSEINQCDAVNMKTKKAPTIIAVIATIIVLIFIVVKLAPTLFIDTEGYMEQGNYQKAYDKAKDDSDRNAVIAENAAAVQSSFSVDALDSLDLLKNPSSFSLRDAYFYKSKAEDHLTLYNNDAYFLVLYIRGLNVGNGSIYMLYKMDLGKKDWNYFGAVSDLFGKERESYDSSEDSYRIAEDIMYTGCITASMYHGIRVSKNGIQRINKMFEEDTLDDIELLDVYED